MEPLQIVDTTLLANKFLLLQPITPPIRHYNIGSSHNAFAKIQNNAETEKHFWMINAVRPINKGISRKIEASPQGATKQIEADCGTN